MKAADLDRACVSNTLVIARVAYERALALYEAEPNETSRLSLERAQSNLDYLEARSLQLDGLLENVG